MSEARAVEAAAEAAASTAAAIDGANARADSVIAAAAEQVNAAQEQAEAIARAAMETELGRRIDANRQETMTWLDELRRQGAAIQEQLANLSSSLRTELQALETKIPVAAVVTLPQTEQSGLTPLVSEAEAVIAPLVTQPPSDAVDPPAPETRARVGRRWV